jgi:hypothetical protein
MGRIAWIAVALGLLTAAPAVQAGLLRVIEEAGKVATEDAAKDAAKAGERNGAKIEVGGATGVSGEVNALKYEGGGGGSGGGGSGGGGGDDAPPAWFYVLCVLGLGGWFLWKFGGKRA